MIKKFTLALGLSFALLFIPRKTFAQEIQVCTQVYGGGVVCGVQAPEHVPVDTAVGGFEPALVGGLSILTSGGLFYISRKLRGK